MPIELQYLICDAWRQGQVITSFNINLGSLVVLGWLFRPTHSKHLFKPIGGRRAKRQGAIQMVRIQMVRVVH